MRKILFLCTLMLSTSFLFAQQAQQTKTNLQLIRNATLVIDYAGQKIVVDPMLSAKGAIASWAGLQTNPTVDLTMPIPEIVDDIDLVLVTHLHEDHFDQAASTHLAKSVPLLNQPGDTAFFASKGFINARVLMDSILWNGIHISRTQAQHGSGEVLNMMGKTSGFVLQAKGMPTVYIIGDGIWTAEVEKNILKFDPDYIVANAGDARIQGFEEVPIIMDEAQVMTLITHSGKAKVIAVHMDALDHCFTTRASLRQQAALFNIDASKLIIPQDGQVIPL